MAAKCVARDLGKFYIQSRHDVIAWVFLALELIEDARHRMNCRREHRITLGCFQACPALRRAADRVGEQPAVRIAPCLLTVVVRHRLRQHLSAVRKDTPFFDPLG